MDNMTDKYRAVFCNSELGQEVLADIVIQLCGFMSICQSLNPQEMAAHEAQGAIGVSILMRLGITNPAEVIKALSAIVPSKPIKKEGLPHV